MKILHVAKGYNSFGGIETVTRQFVNKAHNLGYNCNVICFDKSSEKDYVRAYKSFNIDNQPISYKYLLDVIFRSNEYDIVHIHLPNYLAIIGLLLVRRKKTFIIHWHSDVIQKSVGKYLRFLERWLVKRADIVLYTSKSYFNKSYSRDWVNPQQVSIYPLMVGSNGNKMNADIKISGKILFVGRFVDYKGVFELINLVVANKWENDFRFIGKREKLMDEYLSENHENNNLDILYDVNNNQLIKELKDAKFLILPSKTKAEAFGIVAIEALSSGTPLLTSNLLGSGLSEINIEGVTGYKFEPNQVKNMESVIQLALGISENKYRDLCKASFKRWETIYNQANLDIDEIYRIKT